MIVAAALAPFGISLVPWVYGFLSVFTFLTVPLCGLAGLLWCVLFREIYVETDRRDRRGLRWLIPLAVFAFVLPAHVVLAALGVPLNRIEGFMPP